MLYRPVGDQWLFHETKEGDQILPVNVFESDCNLILVVPLPGMEPENIDVTVAGKTVTIRAGLRGPGQERRQYWLHEWSYGPYSRRLELPVAVDAEHANASFGNGILTLTLRKAATEQTRQIRLDPTGASEGHRRGHSGHC